MSKFSLTLAESQNTGHAWPVSSLKDIKDYSERVEPGEDEPAGECPITGALCHTDATIVPAAVQPLLAAVEEVNKSGDLLVAFVGLPTLKTVKLEFWRTPRTDYLETSGALGEMSVPATEAGVAEVLNFIAKARIMYRSNAKAAHI